MKKNYLKILTVGFCTLSLISGCKEDEKVIPIECTDVKWEYTGTNGAENWDDLCVGFSACGQKSQSPINITGAVENSSLSAINFSYHETPVEIENNGHTIEFVCEAGSKISISGKDYELKQFHYHGSSEHQINGTYSPLEVHFVHKATDNAIAVVGVLFESGTSNPLLEKYLSHFPIKEGNYKATGEKINLSSLMPDNKSYYSYKGSLTTPPCSETVNWFVLQNKLTATSAQLSGFQTILKNNYRPIQALNGRTIYKFNQ